MYFRMNTDVDRNYILQVLTYFRDDAIIEHADCCVLIPYVLLAFFVDVLCATGDNRCSSNNGGCDHLCLVAVGGGAACQCADGWQLDPGTNTSCLGQLVAYYSFL